MGCSLAPVSQLLKWLKHHHKKLLSLQFSVLRAENSHTVIDQENTVGGRWQKSVFSSKIRWLFWSCEVVHLTDVEQNLQEVKRLNKIKTGGLEKIEYFYLSQPITLNPENSIFFYLHTYPEWPGISIFSDPLVYPPNEVVSIFFSIFSDWPLVSFSILHLSPHSANVNLSL